MTFYNRDLALIHDLGHTDFVNDAAPAIIDMLRQAGARRVLDLGCGSGVLAASLLDAGYDVTGIDVSQAMIDLARARAPQATFICASFHDVDLPPADAAVSVGECFNYLNESSNHSLPRLFKRIHDCLTPGGVLIFDMALTGRAGPTGTYHASREGDGWAIMSVATENDAILTRRITSFTRDGEHDRRSDEVHRLKLADADQVLDQLASAGFTPQRLDAYGGVTFPPGYGAFIARR